MVVAVVEAAFQALVVFAFEDSLEDHPLVVVPLEHYNFEVVHSFVVQEVLALVHLVAAHEAAKKDNNLLILF